MAKHGLKELSASNMEALAARFRALGETSRLSIIQALQDGEKCVSELVLLTGLSQPNVSRHLNVLQTAGLIGRRKCGLNAMYRIIDEHLEEICQIVCKSIMCKSQRQ